MPWILKSVAKVEYNNIFLIKIGSVTSDIKYKKYKLNIKNINNILWKSFPNSCNL